MAKTLSKSGIATGQDILAGHVTQSIDALTSIDAYNISISGSLVITGSTNISGSLTAISMSGDGSGLTGLISSSYAVTASYVESSSYAVTASYVESSSYAVTASYAESVSGGSSLWYDGTTYLSSSLPINVEGNITASGDISSSGNITAYDITASHAFHVEADSHAEFTISGSHFNFINQTANQSLWFLTENGTGVIGFGTDGNNGEVIIGTGGNITASADISASGDVYGAKGIFGDQYPIIIDDITTATNQSFVFGDQSLQNTTTGNGENLAIGQTVLRDMTSGTRNIGIGINVMTNLVNSANNIGIGVRALQRLSGSWGLGNNNLAIGYESLRYTQEGRDNTAFGTYTLRGNAAHSNTFTYNTAIGSLAGQDLISGSGNVFIGYEAGENLTQGNSNVFLGFRAAENMTLSNGNTYLGSDTVPSNVSAGIYNETAIGAQTVGQGNNTVQIGSTTVGQIGGAVTFTIVSDVRIKRNIQSGSLGLDFINKLNPVVFQKINPAEYPEEILEHRYTERTKWDTETSSSIIIPPDPPQPTDESWYDGLIAQEVSQSLSELELTSDIWQEMGHNKKQGIKYGALTVPLIKAVQELSAKVTALEAQISGSL